MRHLTAFGVSLLVLLPASPLTAESEPPAVQPVSNPGLAARAITPGAVLGNDHATGVHANQIEVAGQRDPMAPPPGMNLSVIQGAGGHEDITLTAELICRDLGIDLVHSNGGDYATVVGGDGSDDVANGVLISCVREDGRDHGNGIQFATSTIFHDGNGFYYVGVHESPAGGEFNTNVTAAYFPFAEGWMCGHATNGENNGPMTGLNASAGIDLGDEFVDPAASDGQYTLTIPGVDSQTDGILLVCGGKNEDNFALSRANSDSSWTIYCHDNGANGATYENDGVAFAYVPASASNARVGKFDNEGDVILGAGFTVTKIAAGTYRLSATGFTPTTAILLVSPEGGVSSNSDNIVTFEADGESWLIFTRDIDGMGLSDLSLDEPAASFALFEARPEIEIQGNGQSIPNGDSEPSVTDGTDFGTVEWADTSIAAFTIKNLGTSLLDLTGAPLVSLAGDADFAVTLQPALDPVLPGDSTTFEVSFHPGATGIRCAVVSIANSDADENPYTFTVEGSCGNLDFGDAPVPYPVTIAEGGAAHSASGLTLGATRDVEVDGIHSGNADADGSDEDGVSGWSNVQVGRLGGQVVVNVQGGSGVLDAWVDWNRDGCWGGAFEQIADGLVAASGDNAVSFDVPSWAAAGNTVTRFRLSPAGNVAPSGSATGGEVEDCLIGVADPPMRPGVFAASETVAGADGAASVCTADVDGDGDMDVLSAAYDGGLVAWHENDGASNPTFTEHAIASANAVFSVCAADVDGDGDCDVLSASLADVIAWYENDGAANFTTHVITTTADGARCVFTADVDGDGDLDVLAAAQSDNKVAWYENDGSAGFTEHTVTSTAWGACGVFAADVDRDGDMDILSASPTDDTIAWYENDGGQDFNTHVITSTADGAYCVFASDVNRDGDMDVVAASQFDDVIAWYENDGNQNFTRRSITAGADYARSVFATDLDGDGDVDVLSASKYDGTVAWYENSGTQAFTYHALTTSALGATSVFVADVDGDGDLDVLSAAQDSDAIAWYEQLAPPVLTTAEVSDVSDTSATCGGEITDSLGVAIASRGCVWGTSETPTVESHTGITIDSGNPFVSTLTGLTAGTIYVVRAYATNVQGETGYGESHLFAGGGIAHPPGCALEFGGVDRVMLGSAETLALTGGQFTIETWIKPRQKSSISTMIARKSPGADTPGYAFHINTYQTTDARLRFETHSANCGTVDPVITWNAWQHVAVTWDGGTLRFYVNGIEKPASGAVDLLSAGTCQATMGSFSSGIFCYYGTMDEARIWSVARSEAELRDAMHGVLQGDELGLLAYYRFDHFEGTTLDDVSGNGNQGTLMGGEWIASTFPCADAIADRSNLRAVWSLVPSSLSSGRLRMADASVSGLDFVVFGHDGNTDDWQSADCPVGTAKRLSRAWEVELSGMASADIRLDVSGLGGIADSTFLRLLVDDDGTFADAQDVGGSVVDQTFTVADQIVIDGLFYTLGYRPQEFTLEDSLASGELVLHWNTVPPASAYWVFGAANEPYFAPQTESPFAYRVAVTADTTWSSAAGIADPDSNWTYQVIAVDGSEQERGRSNRVGEHEFALP